MTSEPAYRALFLSAGSQMQCGVGQFTRLLSENIEKLAPGNCTTLALTRSEGSVADIWRAAGSARSVVCNFPIVAWKRVLFRPLLALAMARLQGRRIVLIQHEWHGLHWLRRITYIPALLLADTIVMFSPLVRRELADDPVVGWTAQKCVLAPLPPNIEAPANPGESGLRQQLAAAREAGRLVIGHFGSIYPAKQPNALLNICASLKERGLKPLLVFVGSFIRGVDEVEAEFYARAAELGIADDIVVSGYVGSDDEVFGIFSEIDAFCYPLEEGITARRGSILACVQSGRPVIVTSPAEPDEFDRHPRFRELIDLGAIVLVSRGAGDDAYVDGIVSALQRSSVRPAFDFDGWWRDVAQAVQAQLRLNPSSEIAPDSVARTPRSET
jgi:glycosyltransferase involved in cell wall biosynthesis